MTAAPDLRATHICALEDLVPERGAAALVDGVQVALFRIYGDEVYAVQQRDPYSGANVMSRGIVGTRAGDPCVASPMYKQIFDLRTGLCADRAGYEPQPGTSGDLTTHAVHVKDGQVWVELNGAPQ